MSDKEERLDQFLKTLIVKAQAQIPPNPSRRVIQDFGQALAKDYLIYARYEQTLEALQKSGKLKL